MGEENLIVNENQSDLLSCPFCDGGETQIEETRTQPTMSGKSSVIGVYIIHWCSGLTKGAQRITISVHGRNRDDAIEAWNRREKV